MGSTGEGSVDHGTDIGEQVRQLREQLDALMRDKVGPAVTEAASRVQEGARHARQVADEQTEAVAEKVREHPFTSILVAAAVGYVLGRISR